MKRCWSCGADFVGAGDRCRPCKTTGITLRDRGKKLVMEGIQPSTPEAPETGAEDTRWNDPNRWQTCIDPIFFEGKERT